MKERWGTIRGEEYWCEEDFFLNYYLKQDLHMQYRTLYVGQCWIQSDILQLAGKVYYSDCILVCSSVVS